MEWKPKRYGISVSSGAREAIGIVLNDVLGVHVRENGEVIITHLASGKKIGDPLVHLGVAIRVAERLQLAAMDLAAEDPIWGLRFQGIDSVMTFREEAYAELGAD